MSSVYNDVKEVLKAILGSIAIVGSYLIVAGLIVALILCVQWSPGETQYTGYIYSAEDSFGDKTTGHLRFSEAAGKDNQPDFCVQKADGWRIKELAGSGKKVKVTIPAGFKFAWLWDCGIPASIEGMEEVK